MWVNRTEGDQSEPQNPRARGAHQPLPPGVQTYGLGGAEPGAAVVTIRAITMGRLAVRVGGTLQEAGPCTSGAAGNCQNVNNDL